MLNCIILDTGVNIHHKLVKNHDVFGFTLKFTSEKKCVRIEGFNDSYGHGTAIYSIIGELYNDIQITNIKLDSIEESIPEEMLIAALSYINEHCDVNIINLSLGTTICECGNELYDICKKLSDKGIIIVSAFDNEGAISFPAAFNCVIGVTTHDACLKSQDFVFVNDDCINIGAKGNTQRLAWINPDYVFRQGNSFACAHVTKQAIRFLLKEVCGRKNILNSFADISKQSYNLSIKKQKKISKISFDSLRRIALFPFNKEMHSIVRYHHLIQNAAINKIYDSKYSGNVSANIQNIMKIQDIINIKIENIENIDFLSFDTFVFGHFEELSQFYKPNYREQLINKLLDNDKIIISFDNFDKVSKFQMHPNIYVPAIYEEDLPPERMGKLYRISKPVLGVVGTSSIQGKFTLQLALREKFLKNGYNVGHIGTEPQAVLFGMDIVFPMGYNSSVYIRGSEVIRYLNHEIYSLCFQGKDIILAGSQSATVPYDMGNLSLYNIEQHSFLLGINPDAVILLINPFDEMDYVMRTIRYLESLENNKVIALVVYPMTIDSNWLTMSSKKSKISVDTFEEIKQTYENIEIPVFLLGDPFHMEKLFETIINYFEE